MNPRNFFAASTLAFAVFTSAAQADLVSDLNTMSAADALAKAVKMEDVSIETLIADAAAQLSENPSLLSALVSEAVKAFPEQAVSIVQVAISQAPNQTATITSAAVAELTGNPEAQAQVQQAAEQPVAQTQQPTTTETKTEQQEVTPLPPTPATPSTPPPPPVARPSTPDKPIAVSPN